jgi:hypothetical protein
MRAESAQLFKSESTFGRKQAYFEAFGGVDYSAINGHGAVCYTHDQFPLNDAAERYLIGYFAGSWQNFSAEFHFPRT